MSLIVLAPPHLPHRAAIAAGVLYAALAFSANPGAAQTLDAGQRAELSALRTGEMRKLVVLDEAMPAPDTAFTAADGSETTLAASNGAIRLVNFWATWCAPCRAEMPALDALARDFGGPNFAVIPVATGRNNPDAITRFWSESGVGTLETALDPKGRLAAEMDVPGLPVTVVLNREGAEIARMLGGADWDGESGRAVLGYLLALP